MSAVLARGGKPAPSWTPAGYLLSPSEASMWRDKTGCCRSGLNIERQRLPNPDVQRRAEVVRSASNLALTGGGATWS